MRLRHLSSLLIVLGIYAALVTRQVMAQTTSIAQASVAVSIPEASDTTSCSDAISSVEAELAEGGYYIPWQMPGPNPRQIQPEVVISDDDIEMFYYGYPVERTQEVTFALSGDMNRLYQGIMSSPQLMSTFSAQIMAECDQVGLVEFAHWWEGAVPIGYFSDNTARPFTWIDLDPNGPHTRTAETSHGRTVQYEWGYYFAP